MSEQINKLLCTIPQSFTTAEQKIGRENINAAPAGDYAYNSSLSSKMDASASSQFYPATNPSGFVGSSAVSSKQDASAMSSYVAYSAISSDASGNITAIAGSSIGGTGGGVDSATVSAIASSYAESAASSKADSSALSAYQEISGMTAYQPSGDYAYNSSLGDYQPASAMTAYQPSGDYAYNSAVSGKQDSSAMSAYALSSNVSGVIDTVSSNSASWGQGGVDSATVSAIASSYAESAASSKADSSALSAYALSSNVSGVIDTVSSNSASWGGGGGTGDYVEKSATVVTIGDANTANYTTFAQGSGNSAVTRTLAQGSGNRASVDSLTQGRVNSAYTGSFAQGWLNRASSYSFTQGGSNDASSTSFAQGYSNYVISYSFAQGSGNTVSGSSFAQGAKNTSKSGSFAQGRENSATSYSFTQGSGNSASSYSFAHGFGNTAINTAAVFGQYNLRGNGSTSTGDSAAFAIGNGTASGARHDLMLVTRDGEITMYSSTADTTGTGIMSSLRALSAAGKFESGRVSGTGFQPTSALTDATMNNNWVRRSVTDGTSAVSSYAFKSVPQVAGFYALNGNGGWLAIQPSAYSVNMFKLTGTMSNYDWEQASAYPTGMPYDVRMDFVVYGTGNGYVLVNLDAAGTTADLRTGESATMFYDHIASAWTGQTGTHNM